MIKIKQWIETNAYITDLISDKNIWKIRHQQFLYYTELISVRNRDKNKVMNII